MLTQRTKNQLMVFVFISLIGVAYVGARYARLDRLVYDSSYTVTVSLASSGGIFTGAEVTYRGVQIGRVSDMLLTHDGVDVELAVDNKWKIPADAHALIGNKSAVGEQYVELQPQSEGGPYLKDKSVIAVANTAIPVSTTEILTNLDQLVTSVPQGSLQTVIDELGKAFTGTGEQLGQIIDTSNEFIDAANQNFDVTTALIRDGNRVLSTQVAKGSAIRNFARDLALFSGTLADNDANLRALIANGSATANELRTFLEANQVDLGSLIANLVTTGNVIVKHLPGIRQILVMYPYLVATGYTVTARNAEGYNARFGFVLTQNPAVCHQGYDVKERRSPTDGSNRPMDEDAQCTLPINKGNSRGAQNAPRVGTYDLDTKMMTWGDAAAAPTAPASPWDSLLFAPLYATAR